MKLHAGSLFALFMFAAGQSSAQTAPPPGNDAVVRYHATIDNVKYVYGVAPPVAGLKPGNILEANSLDCCGNALQKPGDSFSLVKGDNPLTGPFFVEGAEPGDTLVIPILDLQVDGKRGVGTFGPGFGAANATHYTPMLETKPLAEKMWFYPIDLEKNTAAFQALDSNFKTSFPLHPFLVLAMTQLNADQQKLVEKLVSVHRHWGPDLSSPGMSAVAVPHEKKVAAPGGAYTAKPFRVKASGLPKDQTYNLIRVAFPQFREQVVMSGVGLNGDGIVVCPGKPDTCQSLEGLDDPIDLVLPAAKGEVQHLALTSKDGKLRALFTIIPFPIHAQQNGCSVDMVRLMPMGALFDVSFAGFAPGEAINIRSDSEGEVHSSNYTADALGNHQMALLPAVQGKDSGTVVVSATSAKCTVSASATWGKGADKPE